MTRWVPVGLAVALLACNGGRPPVAPATPAAAPVGNVAPGGAAGASPVAANGASPVAATGEDPAALYGRYCALCHGADREGYAADNAPSLRSPELLGAGRGPFLMAAIAHGRPGTPMAAFGREAGGPLTRPQIVALHDWLVADAEPIALPATPVTGDPAAGAALYAARCASCHGDAGQGVSAPALANPVYHATVSDRQIRHAISAGRTGTPMVGFAGDLDERRLDDLTVYLRTFARHWTPGAPVAVQAPPPEAAVLNPGAPPAKLTLRDGFYVPADEVKAALDAGRRIVLLDARPVSDWQRGHLPGALPVPFYDDVSTLVPHLPRDETFLVAYCACPHAASGKVARKLRSLGFDRAVVLDEGSLEWARRGYPMEPGPR
jgi:mono/diheme cytochrome c family protein/rhodanese-related sulfurtransferase